MFPLLAELHDRVEKEVSGAHLREIGLDPDVLIEGGLLEQRGRQDIILTGDQTDEDAEVKPSRAPGMVRVVGPFGEDHGDMPAADLIMYEINRKWLHETVVGLIAPLLRRGSRPQVLDPDLTLLGIMDIHGADVPVYLARRLDNPETVRKVDLVFRARNNAGVGIVLAASPTTPGWLGPNVVAPLLDSLSPDGDVIISRDCLELAYRTNFGLARGGMVPQVIRSGRQSASLHIPGKDPLALLGANQIDIFERLVTAYNDGSPDVQVKDLMAGFSASSPAQAFGSKSWESIKGIYISKGAKRGYWRLVTEASPAGGGDAPGSDARDADAAGADEGGHLTTV